MDAGVVVEINSNRAYAGSRVLASRLIRPGLGNSPPLPKSRPPCLLSILSHARGPAGGSRHPLKIFPNDFKGIWWILAERVSAHNSSEKLVLLVF
jgi:hypothetical protein